MGTMGEWNEGLFGCFNNCGICIITYFLPCVTAGQVAESTNRNCCLWGFLSMLGCIGVYTMAVVRGDIRETNGIQGSFGSDCLIMWFCAPCGLCQEAAQVQGTG